MIELRPRTDEPISHCARCGWIDFNYVDGDDLEAAWMLPDDLQRPDGYCAGLGIASCAICTMPHCFLELNMIDADVDEDFRSDYLWMNGDIEPSAYLDPHRDGERWFVSRFETPRGVLLSHFFGYFPLQATLEETVQFGHQFLIERWAELRELARAPVVHPAADVVEPLDPDAPSGRRPPYLRLVSSNRVPRPGGPRG